MAVPAAVNGTYATYTVPTFTPGLTAGIVPVALPAATPIPTPGRLDITKVFSFGAYLELEFTGGASIYVGASPSGGVPPAIPITSYEEVSPNLFRFYYDPLIETVVVDTSIVRPPSPKNKQIMV